MSTFVRGADVRLGQLGRLVSRATAAIPQAAAGSIFTVTGGNAILTSLVGEVTTAMDAVATTLLLGFTPSAAGGSLTAWSIASADLTGAIVGSHLALPAAAASALKTDLAGPGFIDTTPAWLMPPGAITLTGTGLNTGGRIKWDITYIPLETGTTVVAA